MVDRRQVKGSTVLKVTPYKSKLSLASFSLGKQCRPRSTSHNVESDKP